MNPEIPGSIGDPYSDYVDDELGYNYHAFEVISAVESRRHARIRHAADDELETLAAELGDLSDLEHWALARAYLKRDERDAYFRHVEPILKGDNVHPALHYPEIYVDVARQHTLKDDLERARELADRIKDEWPELEEAIPLLHAQLLLVAGRVQEADDAYIEAVVHHEDVDLLIETAEDFEKNDEPELAHKWLQRARDRAEQDGDRASLVDIELLENKLPEIESDTAVDDSAG